MAITVAGNGESFSSDDKRFYTPHVMTTECPECKETVERDCSSWYFAYPTFNSQFELTLHCDSCEHEWPVTVRLNLALEIL